MAGRKEIQITLQVGELMYDVMNKAYLTGESRRAAGADYKLVSAMQASGDEDNLYQLRRSLIGAIGLVKSRLGEYIDEDSSMSDDLISDEVENNGSVTLKFSLPNNFNTSAVKAIAEGIHSFIVDSVLSDWFAIVNPQEVKYYAEHSITSLASAEQAIYKRERPIRRVVEVEPR